MATLAFALLLTAVTMAQASQMSDVLKMPPHKYHAYIFEVTSEASVENLKAALGNFTIRGAFKIVGENQFFFEIYSNDTAALHALTFPADSVVVQHTVEPIKDYLEMFQAGEGWENSDPETKVPDAVLLFVDIQWSLPETKCTETFAMEMKEWARQYKKIYNMNKPRIYPVMTNYPPRMLDVLYNTANVLENVVKRGAPATGGIGSRKLMIKRAIEI